MFRKERGFTLIELLIVIAIIGILAVAILPKFVSFDTDAKRSASLGNLSSLRAALLMHRAKEATWASTFDTLTSTYIDHIPPECFIADETQRGTLTAVDTFEGGATTGGGWMLFTDTHEIIINDSSNSMSLY
jgi:prepilin-type N-terminal cleavage/methylation domain-containing protein